jgi:hypothetical protein
MSQSHKDDAREEANKHRFVDQSGLEASQLPDKGRPTGDNDTVTDVGRRNLPQQHGGGQRPPRAAPAAIARSATLLATADANTTDLVQPAGSAAKILIGGQLIQPSTGLIFPITR